jgi:glutaredoxin
MLKDLLDRARRIAEEHLPEDVLDAGRKLGRTVAAHAPAPLAEVIHYVTGDPEAEAAKAEAVQSEAAKAEAAKAEAAQAQAAQAAAAQAQAAQAQAAEAQAATLASAAATLASVAAVRREDPLAVLERVRAKAERGLKPEDRLVVIYATPDEDEDVQAILGILATIEAEVRQSDLRREPQTARQLAKLTGVMVPPYVFINGRHWGNRYDLESLAAWGDLPKVVANLLDDLSDEARRLGHVHESFSDELSVENILRRWKLGHILCVDDLDSWYEVDREHHERFFYQGGPRPVEDMQAVAEEIVRAVEAEEYEAVWQLEPSVHLP